MKNKHLALGLLVGISLFICSMHILCSWIGPEEVLVSPQDTLKFFLIFILQFGGGIFWGCILVIQLKNFLNN